MTSLEIPSAMSPELSAIVSSAAARWEATALAAPSIDPFPAFTKTHRVFVWTIMYLAEKPAVIAALRRHYADVCSGGDIAMHRLIDFLEGNDASPTAVETLYNSSGVVKHYWSICLEYMRGALKNWLDQGRLEPITSWAD